MNVCVYAGSEKLVKLSGVGRALLHQREALKRKGVTVQNHVSGDTEIVHLNTVLPDSVWTARKAKRQGKKVIYYGHSTMEDFRNSFVGSNLLAPLFKRWITYCYGWGDVVITPTSYSQRILETYGIHKPIYALSNGIDADYYQRGEQRTRFRDMYHIPESETVVMSVGHFMERKGILDYIALAKRNPNVTFYWFGYTHPILVPAKIKKAMKEAPDNLHFAGYVDREALRDAYHGCDTFLFMSHEETEGIVVLEALAAGIPVVVRDIPVYEGWLQHGFNVYKARNLDEFEDYLKYVEEHGAGNLVENGLQTAREKDLRRIGERLLAMYETIPEIDASSLNCYNEANKTEKISDDDKKDFRMETI